MCRGLCLINLWTSFTQTVWSSPHPSCQLPFWLRLTVWVGLQIEVLAGYTHLTYQPKNMLGQSSLSTYLPQAVSCLLWLSHSIKTALDIYLILIFFSPTFLPQVLREWLLTQGRCSKITCCIFGWISLEHQTANFCCCLWLYLLVYFNIGGTQGVQTGWNLKENGRAFWITRGLPGYAAH